MAADVSVLYVLPYYTEVKDVLPNHIKLFFRPRCNISVFSARALRLYAKPAKLHAKIREVRHVTIMPLGLIILDSRTIDATFLQVSVLLAKFFLACIWLCIKLCCQPYCLLSKDSEWEI